MKQASLLIQDIQNGHIDDVLKDVYVDRQL